MRPRHLLPGAAIGDGYNAPGTFCCFVRPHTSPREIHLLSTAHVIADEGLAPLGLPLFSRSVCRDPIARLSRIETVRFSSRGHENCMDAALATVEADYLPDDLPPLEVSDRISGGMKVRYRTADGVIEGKVLDARYDFAMYLKSSQTEVARAGFRSHVLCSVQSLAGDSGGAVVDERGRLIGMHVAGNDDGAIFTPIVPILTTFGVEPLGGGPRTAMV